MGFTEPLTEIAKKPVTCSAIGTLSRLSVNVSKARMRDGRWQSTNAPITITVKEKKRNRFQTDSIVSGVLTLFVVVVVVVLTKSILDIFVAHVGSHVSLEFFFCANMILTSLVSTNKIQENFSFQVRMINTKTKEWFLGRHLWIRSMRTHHEP